MYYSGKKGVWNNFNINVIDYCRLHCFHGIDDYEGYAKLTVNDKYTTLTSRSGSHGSLLFNIYNKLIYSKYITASIVYKTNSDKCRISLPTYRTENAFGNHKYFDLPPSDVFTIKSFTYKPSDLIHLNTGSGGSLLSIDLYDTEKETSIDIVAVKVEYGQRQTLGFEHNGNVILYEIPDKHTQELKCKEIYEIILPNNLNANSNIICYVPKIKVPAIDYRFSSETFQNVFTKYKDRNYCNFTGTSLNFIKKIIVDAR